MALYVHPENQQMLWGLINTNPHMTQIFSKYHPSQKSEWFKSIIESFYNQNKHKEMTKTDLHQLNKETLAYMIQLTQQIPPLGEQHLDTGNYSPIYQQPKQEIFDAPQQQLNTQYITKEKPPTPTQDYKPLFDKGPPPPIDFREKDKDTAITNMDDLIQKHMREREEELKLIPPPQITVDNTQNIPVIEAKKQVENIPVVETLKENIIFEKESNNLKVGFQKDVMSEIRLIKTELNELKNDIRLFFDEIRNRKLN